MPRIDPVVAVDAVDDAVGGRLAMRAVVLVLVTMPASAAVAFETEDGGLRGDVGRARYDFRGEERPDEEEDGWPLRGERGSVRELCDFGDKT